MSAKLSDRLRPNCEAAPWVIDEVKKLEETNKALREAVRYLAIAGDFLLETSGFASVPQPNCSCHLCAPCSDCTTHADAREASKSWKEAVDIEVVQETIQKWSGMS